MYDKTCYSYLYISRLVYLYIDNYNNKLWRQNMKNRDFKKGFTLAEVLITLAIIGVVAAMTIPTLISNYKKHTVETKLKRVYSVMNNAIKLSTIDNGETATWDTLGTSSTTSATYQDVLEWYNKYLANYIKASKIEKAQNSEDLLLYFPDGSVLVIKRYLYDMHYFTDYKAVDNPVNGVSYFAFRFQPKYLDESQINNPDLKYAINSGFETYSNAWDGTVEGTKYAKYGYGCFEQGAASCAKLIQLNGWKIPDDYPYKF